MLYGEYSCFENIRINIFFQQKLVLKRFHISAPMWLLEFSIKPTAIIAYFINQALSFFFRKMANYFVGVLKLLYCHWICSWHSVPSNIAQCISHFYLLGNFYFPSKRCCLFCVIGNCWCVSQIHVVKMCADLY